MTDSDGTSGFNLNNVTGTKLDTVVLWHGTTLPTAGTNKVPQYGLFLKTDTGIVYENTNTLASPTWTARTITGGQTGDQVYPIDITSGNYAFGTSPIASSEALIISGAADVTDDCSTDNFTDNDSAVMGVSAGSLTWNFIRDASINTTVRDITSTSDTSFLFRCKLVVSTVTTGTESMYGFIGLTDLTQISEYTSVGDRIGIRLTNTAAGLKEFVAIGCNGADVFTPTTSSVFATALAVGTYYLQIKRTSPTSCAVALYSDSTYTTLIEEETLVITSGYTGLRYIAFQNWNSVASGGALNGTADDFQLWKTTTLTLYPATNIIDGDAGTRWQSNSENNPNVYFDMGASKELHAIMLNIDKTNTTETEIQIRASTDTSFSSPETVRTLLISDFTDDTNRFLTIPRAITDKRYVQIYGLNTSKVLAINEAKYLTKSSVDFEKGHFHKYLSPTDNTANSLDSN